MSRSRTDALPARFLALGGLFLAICLLGGMAARPAGADEAAIPEIDTAKPAFIVTSLSRLAEAVGNEHAVAIVRLADRYGDVVNIDGQLGDNADLKDLDDDPVKYIGLIDQYLEDHFDSKKYSCLLVLGGENVVPMGRVTVTQLICTAEDPVDDDVQYTDDVYGDFDHDAIGLPDIPVARIPDGKDHATMEAQLRGTIAPRSGGMVRYNRARPSGLEVGRVFGAGTEEEVPPVDDAGLDANLRYYYFILHGLPTSDTWSGDKPKGGYQVGLSAKKATARGVVYTSACYGGYMIDETAESDIGLHFLRSGTRGYVASPSMTYSYRNAATGAFTAESREAKMAALFFAECKAGNDPLLALFRAKHLYAQQVGSETFIDIKTIHQFNYFGLPFVAAGTSKPSPSPSPTPTGTSSGRSDTVLIMDVSGSMGDSMGEATKMDAAKSAAASVVSMVQSENSVAGGSSALGLVSFSDTANLDQLPSTDHTTTQAAIEALGPQDSTSIGDGLTTGLGAFFGEVAGVERLMILLSDGQSNQGMSDEEILAGPVVTAAAAGVKIFTIGFGEGGELNEELLRQIADRTGGAYYYADEAFKLENVYIRVRHEAAGTVLAEFNGISGSTAAAAGSFAIDAQTGELHGTLNTEGDAANIVLSDPYGRAVQSEYPGALLFADSDPVYVVVKNPLPGTWKVVVQSHEGTESTYDVVVSARGVRRDTNQYRTMLLLASAAAVGVALLLALLFRWPLRR